MKKKTVSVFLALALAASLCTPALAEGPEPVAANTAGLAYTLGVAVSQREGKMGVVRMDGKELIAHGYDELVGIGYGLYLARLDKLWGVVSMVALPSKLGGNTQELYPIAYDSIVQGQNSGLSVLTFTKEGVRTVVPLSTLPGMLAERGAPSAQFPLTLGRTASFTDVKAADWYAVWVEIAYNVGLVSGKGDSKFDPLGTLTVAEALQLAANMESRFTGDNFHAQPTTGTPWYRQAVAYCVASGIIQGGEFTQMDQPVTRSEMAKIFAATSLGRSMPNVNDINRVKQSLPDVKSSDYAATAIYDLYAKGVFIGTDGALTFRPSDQLTRAEAATIVTRMARAEQRITLW